MKTNNTNQKTLIPQVPSGSINIQSGGHAIVGSRIEGNLDLSYRQFNYQSEQLIETSTQVINRGEDFTENKNHLVNQLKARPELTSEEVEKISDYLRVKKTFLIARQTAIEELQKCLNALEKKLGKHALTNETGSAISNIGGAITDVITFGIPRAVGEIIIARNNFSKINLSDKGNEEFKVSLENKEKELIQLNSTYNSLVSFFNLKAIGGAKLFSIDYQVFDVLADDGIWKGRTLNPEKMEVAIVSLNKNLKVLKAEYEEEIKELQDKFGAEKIKVLSSPGEEQLLISHISQLTSEELVEKKVGISNYQTKNFNLGERINQSWEVTCECLKNCAFKWKTYLTIPIDCWEDCCSTIKKKVSDNEASLTNNSTEFLVEQTNEQKELVQENQEGDSIKIEQIQAEQRALIIQLPYSSK